MLYLQTKESGGLEMYYEDLTAMGLKYTRIAEDLPVILLKEEIYDTSVLFFNWLLVKWQVINYKDGKKLEPLCYSTLSQLAKEYANKDRKTLRLMLKDLTGAKLIKLSKEGHKIKIDIVQKTIIELYKKWGENTQKKWGKNTQNTLKSGAKIPKIP